MQQRLKAKLSKTQGTSFFENSGRKMLAATIGAAVTAFCFTSLDAQRRANDVEAQKFSAESDLNAFDHRQVSAVFYTKDIKRGTKIKHSMLEEQAVDRKLSSEQRVSHNWIIVRRIAMRDLKKNQQAKLSDFGLQLP